MCKIFHCAAFGVFDAGIVNGVFTGCRSTRQSVDLTPLANVDLPRYLGCWYEIARFDHWFERGMTQTKANYGMREE